MDEQLITAIQAKDLHRVEELLAAGANPNARKGDETAYQLVPHAAHEIKCALIEAGAEDSELRHALVWAIGRCRVEVIRILIEKGTDINVDTYSGSPIGAAARGGHVEVVELLIAAGADVDAGSMTGTPLVTAIEAGHMDIALKLIAAGAEPNLSANFGSLPPIAMAASQGSEEVIRALIAAGADVNAQVSHITLNRLQVKKETASSLKTAFGALEAVGEVMESLEELNEDEASPDRLLELESEMKQVKSRADEKKIERPTEPENVLDTFPVIIAASCNRPDALTVLLEAGANPHCKDGEGMSAYDWAVRVAGNSARQSDIGYNRGKENLTVLEVLRRFGITETLIDADEKLLQAAASGNVARIEESLTQGANVNARDPRRRTRDKTPLMLASMAGHLAAVRVLLKAGAEPNMTDREPNSNPISKSWVEHAGVETQSMGSGLGRTALMGTAIAGYSDAIRELLQAGADPNHKDDVEYTALALAVENGRLAAVQELVAAGAEVDMAVTYGNTPLILACEKSDIEIAEFLVMEGADVTKTNRDNETALMKAAAAGSFSLVRLLIERGADVNAVSQGLERSTALAWAAGASYYAEVNKNTSSSGIREYRDDGSCWEWQPLPEEQNLEVVRSLLQAGADPNISDCDATPLIKAAEPGKLRVLQLLLESGARLDLRNTDGDTAASIAKLYGHQEIRLFLQKYTGTDLSEFDCQEPEYKRDPEEEEKRWGEELPQPDFSEAAKNPNYQQAVRELGKICGSTPVSPSDDFPGWFSIHVSTKRRQDINTEELQRQFLEKGCFVYEPRYSSGESPERLAIIPTTDKYEAIALHQTNGCNYGVGPGYVVEWLKDLEVRQPFVLTRIANDTLEGRFLTPVEDPEGLAEQMYDFCSDIVDQGCASVELLAESLASSDNLFFWWD